MVMGVHQKKLRVKVVHGEKRLRTTALNDVLIYLHNFDCNDCPAWAGWGFG